MFVPDVFCGNVLNFVDVDMKIENALSFDVLSKVTSGDYKVVRVDEEWLLVILNLNPYTPVFKDKNGMYYIVVDKNDREMIEIIEVMNNGFI